MITDFSSLEFTLETARLHLRPIREADAKLMWPYVSNPELPKYMCWNAHQDISETKKFCRICEQKLQSGKGITWSIFYNDSFCGLIGLDGICHVEAAIRYDSAGLGYWLAPEYRKKGIMTEATKAVLCFGFEQIQLHKITAMHFKENMASKGVIQKLGFRLVGYQKEDAYRDGKWHDHVLYEMLEHEHTFS